MEIHLREDKKKTVAYCHPLYDHLKYAVGVFLNALNNNFGGL